MARSSHTPPLLTLVALLFVFNTSVHADFDKATKAYLQGNYEEARYEALVAATDGNPKAQMLMGQLYFNGEGVPKDIAHALYWYGKAAENGFTDAQYRLGILYDEGKNGVEKNLDAAYKWLTMAADSGLQDAKEKLEWLFKTDDGKVVNLNENIEVLKQVAGSGNKQARFLLSEKMLKGAGVPQDKITAVKMLREDAEQGVIKAQKQLGELYFYGDGVEKDYLNAYGWSMAYAGTTDLGGIAREGKQVARSALRKIPEETHNDAYLRSKEYYEKFVKPFHPNAREVGPDKYRIVVRTQAKNDQPARPGGITKSVEQASKTDAVQQSKPAAEGLAAADTSPVPATGTSATSDAEVKSETTTPTMTVAVPTPEISVGSPVAKVTTESATSVVDNLDKSDSKKESENVPPSESASQSVSVPAITVGVAETGDVSPAAEDSKVEAEVVDDKGRVEALAPESEAVAAVNDVNQVSKTPELPERNFDSVYNVLVRKKAGLMQLYYREYELDKKLEGRMVFDIVISPDGKITGVEVMSNTVESPTLEQDCVDYLKSNVTFSSEPVAEYRISYPVDFLPPPS